MKSTHPYVFCLLLLLVTNNNHRAQAIESNVFKEENGSLSEYFLTVEDLKEQAIGVRYGEINRSKGFLVNDIVKNASAFTKNLHKSGKVIFNCEASDYLNSLKSKLLQDYPEIDKLVKVHITKNSTLNAFATVNNNVYVNIGLLARIENEAQLSFILCHELMHIVNAHIINQSVKISEAAHKINHQNVVLNGEIMELYKHALSREHECEADLDGFKLFLKQSYKPQEAISSLQDGLRKANDLTLDIKANHITFYLPNSDSLSLWMKYKDDLFFEDDSASSVSQGDSTSSVSQDEELYTTHPALDLRTEKIKQYIADNKIEESKGVVNILSDEDFNRIKETAKGLLMQLYAEEKDFTKLFLISSQSLNHQGDNSESNLNYLGYSIQGMVYDKLSDYKINRYISTSIADSLLNGFFDKSKKEEFANWGISALNKLSEEYGFERMDRYFATVAQTCYNSFDKEFKSEFKSGTLNKMNQFKKDSSSSLAEDLEKLNFEISPAVSMSKSKIRKFNSHHGKAQSIDSKVAIINMNNIVIKNRFFFNLQPDKVKMEKLDLATNKVWKNLEVDYSDNILSIIPSAIEYNSKDYELYVALNNWTNERFYFMEYDYIPLDTKGLSLAIEQNNIQYVFLSVNIQINGFNLLNFIPTYFAPFVVPHYMPQLIAGLALGSARKYQLSIIIDTKTGKLAGWDKRTSIEPNTIAQYQMIYNNVFSNFLLK
jgi:hypothetical protein